MGEEEEEEEEKEAHACISYILYSSLLSFYEGAMPTCMYCSDYYYHDDESRVEWI